jgi:serine/threonine protein kinase/tetratricopeptide (TPR) repeat protein
MTAPAQTLKPGDAVGKGYVVERFLGGGGMGQVYLARDTLLNRQVAVKILHSAVAAHPEADARFQHEAQAMSRVVHPNVVGIHAFGGFTTADGTEARFLVMEYVEGHSLEQALLQGPLPLREVLTLTRQIASGLAEAHALGIVHRDIKPGNILLRPLASGSLLAKVVDFGLARTMRQEGGRGDDTLAGTPAYMSPEQIQRLPLDGRADLYALAVVVYQMLTGQQPFWRQTIQDVLVAQLREAPPSLREFGPASGLPPQLEREVLRALAKSPDQRHASVVAFAEALEQAAELAVELTPDSVSCPGCGLVSRDGGGFCQRCGGALPRAVCVTCGARRDGERYRCGDCGASLLERSSSANSLHSGLRMASAVVLVARLSSPVRDVTAQAEFASSFIAAVEREGGRPVALLGSESIALFGVGGSRDDEIGHAVDAALALQATGQGRSWTLDGEGDLQIGVETGLVGSRGIGVTWGLAIVGGETVDAARRAAIRAPAGAVVVGDAAWRETRALFDVRISDDVRVVMRRRDPNEAPQAANGLAQQPLLGRMPAWQQLDALATEVRAGQRLRCVMVQGPEAAGKSRLLAEWCARQSGWQVDMARCGRHGATVAYEPFLEVLRQHIGPAAEASFDTTASVPHLPELDIDPVRAPRRATSLARLLGWHRSEPGVAVRPASDTEVQALFEAYLAFLTGACAKQPLVLVIDDCHRADAGSLELLRQISRNCRDMPLLLLLVARSGHSEPLTTALDLTPEWLTQIELTPLSIDDCQALTVGLLSGQTVAAPLLELVHRFADGWPGRVEDAIDTLRLEDALVCSGRVCSVADGAAAMLERSERDRLMRRVGRLAPAERVLLDSLAVAGEDAPEGILSAMLEAEVSRRDLDTLQQAGLVAAGRGARFGDFAGWRLRHEGAGPLLLEAMPRAACAALHDRAANWLIGWSGSHPAGLDGTIGRHLVAAGRPGDAFPHLLRSAESAMRAFANRDAFAIFGQAATAAEAWCQATPADPAAQEARLRALVRQAELGLRVGELATALEAASAAVVQANTGADRALWRARALSLRGQILDASQRSEEALAVLREAIATCAGVVGAHGTSTLASSLLAMALMRLKRYDEVEAVAREALVPPPQGAGSLGLGDFDDRLGTARMRTWLGHIASLRGQHATARDHYGSAKATFLELKDDVLAAMIDISLANLAYRAGDRREAEAMYRAASANCQGNDDLVGTATAEANLASVLLDDGRPSEALEALALAERLQRRSGRADSLPEIFRLQRLARGQLEVVDAGSAGDSAQIDRG